MPYSQAPPLFTAPRCWLTAQAGVKQLGIHSYAGLMQSH